MFCSRKKDVKHPKWVEWCKKSEKEQSEIAEKNEWLWYFDWLEIGDTIRYKYEKADTDPKVANKYGGYDRWYETHKTEYSYVYVGIDGSINESKQPIREWTVFNPCTNKNCPYNQGEYANKNECGYFGSNEQQYDCFNDLFASIQAFIDICGKKDLDKLAKDFNIHKDIIGWFKYGDKYFKGDDKMSKPFLTELSELNLDDEIAVYWTGNIMYIEDRCSNQASTNTSLFEAYKFSILINATYFDYSATDEELKQLSEELLDLVDEDFYRINVWEYIDNISEDFKKLTGIQLDIDDKRNIVCGMTDDDAYGILCDFGSATYIAKLLWRYIKGDNHIKTQTGELLFKDCGNPVAHELANKYLKTDDYDLIKFAKTLHKECEYKMSIPKNFNEYLIQSHNISEKCYYLLGQLINNNREYQNDILVGYIDWFGNYEENERYIYCHIDSEKNEIYFYENKKNHKKGGYAFLHDIAFHHLVNDPSRIQEDIIIKFTNQYIDQIVKDKMYDIYGCTEENDIYDGNDWGYNYCHMYCNTIGKYIG